MLTKTKNERVVWLVVSNERMSTMAGGARDGKTKQIFHDSIT